MNEYIELRWNSHASTFLENLSSLRDQQIFTDVTVSCGNQFYPAHRLVLSSCSSFFARSLEMLDCKSSVLMLYGIEQIILEHLLMFMYDGQVTISRADLPNFLQAARWLGIKGLDVGNGNSDGKGAGRASQSEILEPQAELSRHFQTWKELISPHVSSMDRLTSLDDMTSALRQMVGRLDNERTVGDLVVSNVTSLCTQVQTESIPDSNEHMENGLDLETTIKSENIEVPMEEEMVPLTSSPFEDIILDTSDSSSNDNDFEGWDGSAVSVPSKFEVLQHRINLNKSLDSVGASSRVSSSDFSSNHYSETETITETLGQQKRPLRCNQCKIVFEVREELAEHLRSHGHNFCYICSKGFVSVKRYQLHMKSHKKGLSYSCNYCDFVSHSKRGLGIHSASHSRRGLETHSAHIHGQESHEIPQSTEEDDPKDMPNSVALLTCNLCGFRSNHARGFKKHMTCMHSRRRWREYIASHNSESFDAGENSFSCDKCDFSTSGRPGLKRHVTCKHDRPSLYYTNLEQEDLVHRDDSLENVTGHADDSPEKVEERPQEGQDQFVAKYKCNICDFSSIHKRGFKKHMSCIHDITDIEADSPVVNEVDLMRSVLRSGKKRYACQRCERTFESYRLYYQHEVLGCGRYRCKYCKMRYRTSEKKEYLEHLQLHEKKETPSFRCSHCSFVTNLKSEFDSHVCNEINANPFHCTHCSFSSESARVVQTHIIANHKEIFSQDNVPICTPNHDNVE